MNEKLGFEENLALQICRKPSSLDLMALRGHWRVEHIRKGKLYDIYEIPNTIVTVGKNSLFDVYFRAQTQLTAWYTGLVDNSGWTAFDVADTMSSHAGWTEFHTGYSQSTRVQWSPAAASAGSVSNSTPMQFDITATATLKGIFVCSVSTKNTTTGTLWSAAAFASTVPVANTDQLKLTYTVSA